MKQLLMTITVIFIAHLGFTQDQRLVDSLTNQLKVHKKDTFAANALFQLSTIYRENDFEKGLDYANKCLSLSESIGFKKGIANAYNNMGVISFYKGEYVEGLQLHSKAFNIRKEIGDKKGIAGSLNNLGNIYQNLGNYPEALKHYLAALKINEQTGNKKWKSFNLLNIASIYTFQENFNEALKNYNASLEICNELGDDFTKANNHNNIGSIYARLGNYDEAMKSYKTAYQIRKEINNPSGIANSLMNIGTIQMFKGDFNEALKNLFSASEIQEKIEDKSGLITSLIYIGQVYILQKKFKEAEISLNKGLKLSKEIGYIDLIKSCHEELAKLYSLQGRYKESLSNYKSYVVFRDSLLNNESTKKSVALQMNYDFEKKQDSTKAVQEKRDAITQKELQTQKLLRNVFIGGFSVVLLFAIVFLNQRNKIKIGKHRSDELLLNILPEEVADELKTKGSADAKHFEEVTTMFTDFKGFTQISEKLTPNELVNEIHTCFEAFDNIITKYNVEKIKTIGDAYMCAGGLPVANKSNPFDVVNAAIEIQQFMNEHIEKRKNKGKEVFEIRIGIHTGPVVAGIVGVKKFAYDIWGDAVNIAARMESSGEVGRINISSTTYELVKNNFTCTYRGKVNAKNKGEIDMYFVDGVI